MNRLKVMTILGTRPEIIRLSEVIKACDKYFDHLLVHTGQNWDDSLNQIFFDELSLPVPHSLKAAGNHLGETVGNIITKSYELICKENPDALLILGDTNSALAAYPAKRLKIPIFHMEAGSRCFDQNVPEEINRKIIDHISDINLPYTENARQNLLGEGLRKEHIFVTGSPMPEVLQNNMGKILASPILSELGLNKNGYFLLSAHREENIDNENTFYSLMEAVNTIAEAFRMPVIYSTHPRSQKLIRERGFSFHPLVRQFKPFGFFAYNYLQLNASCVLSDSGTVSEESAILGFPAILVRTSTEHPEVLEKGSLILGGVAEKDIIQAVQLSMDMKKSKPLTVLPVDYHDQNVSQKVVHLIQSYTHIIKRAIWKIT